MKILVIVYGTRPEFLKLRPLIDKCREEKLNIKVIRVNQHASFHDDEGYYDSQIDIIEGGSRIASIGTSILHDLPPLLEDAVVLVQGDTATAFYAALAAFQNGIRVIHLEAGMRTYDLENPFPEEGYRQMISRITDLHLCPSLREAATLNMREGTEQDRIFVVGNTILDLVKSYNFHVSSECHVVITMHRRENWASYCAYIKSLTDLAARTPNLIFEFYAHPNPALREEISKVDLPANFLVLDPLGHRDLVARLASCAFVITDSGGIQEEANFLGKHMYVLRRCTERISISPHKITLLSDPETISTINCAVPVHEPGYEYGNGNACADVINIIKNKYMIQ
jgi:UDP-N-acetylglucosamine 2-epimerase (non-hydrolysing)